MRTAYKCRAYPDPEQAAQLGRTFGCVRLVWNKTLADRQAAYHQRGEKTSYKATDAELTEWKRGQDLAFLGEVSSVPLQQTLRHQHTAFANFFAERARHPRFKSRNGRQSAHYTRSAFRIREGQLFLAKQARPLEPAWSWPETDLAALNPTTVIVSREPDGRFYVTFAVETDDPEPALGAAVVPAPDPVRLSVPKAYLTLAPGHEPTRETARAVFAHARQNLAPWQRVRRLEFADLPKTVSGKIRRVELRAREQEGVGEGEWREEEFPDLRTGGA